MNKHCAYVDDSCLYIEGQVASALSRGLARTIDPIRAQGLRDWTFAIDFKALLIVLDASRDRAWLVGSRTTDNGAIWRHATAAGFRLMTVPRVDGRKEKEVDAELMLTAMETTADLGAGDMVTLVSGDRDFVPLVRRLRARGIAVRVFFWEHATSSALVREASSFRPMDPVLQSIRLNRRAA